MMHTDDFRGQPRPLYFDYQSTTPMDPAVLDYMQKVERDIYGNAASKTHEYGRLALETVELARAQVAGLADCDPAEVFFTSGATESINTALKGAWLAGRGRKVVTFTTEHNAVLDTVRWLTAQGAKTAIFPVEPDGTIPQNGLNPHLEGSNTLLSISHGNNEIGVVHPVELLRPRFEGLLHVDAAQTFGKIPVSVRKMQIDLLSVSSHKLYGPKGVGALIKRRQQPPLRLEPLIHGGGHERGVRSGTLNVPGIAGFGLACAIAGGNMVKEASRLKHLRDLLLADLNRLASPLIINGSVVSRLPGNLNISFPEIEGPQLIPRLRPFLAVSSGSACSSANPSPSHVLKALGASDSLAAASIRFGIGRFTTEDEVHSCAEVVGKIVTALRREHYI